ncbi:MAG: methyl-accepting chemotaxis protein [Bacillota bacterium]
MKLKVGTRIMLGFGLLVIFLIIVGGISYTNFNSVEKLKNQILEKNYPGVRAAEAILSSQVNQGLGLRGFLLTGQEEFINNYERYKKECSDAVQQSFDLAYTQKVQDLVKKAQGLSEQYGQIGDKIISLKKEGKETEALNLMQREAVSLMDQTRQTAEEIIGIKEKQMEDMSKEIDASISRGKQIILIMTVAALVISIIVSAVTGRSITKPVAQIAEVTRQVAQGDLTKSITYVGQDELGDLAKTFNSMVRDLRSVVGHIIDASHQLAAASEELSSSSQQTAAAAEQVSKTISDVASGATEQSKSVNEASAVLDELSVGVRQVAQNVMAVNNSSNKARSAATMGQEDAALATVKMEQVQSSAEAAAKTIEELRVGSEKIGEIVDVIKGIAGQTNLLALNAAIEAARAGEQGRGFAVVAEEVRKLAEESRVSAETIANLINNIQIGTAKAVEAMNLGAKDVEEGVKTVRKSISAFNAINKEILEVSEQVEQVSAASQQMASGSEQVVVSMKNIEKLSGQMDAGAQEVAASVEEQTASMEAVASQAEELAKLAEQLQLTIAKFQI